VEKGGRIETAWGCGREEGGGARISQQTREERGLATTNCRKRKNRKVQIQARGTQEGETIQSKPRGGGQQGGGKEGARFIQ